ncbi:hypothetical protein [Rhodobacter sp. 24-YEA-8]|nr:hypothetical protein [Rhodobacter sp. 24-YEA-8]
MKKARSKGKCTSPGYLLYYSGGNGHGYTLDVIVVDGRRQA